MQVLPFWPGGEEFKYDVERLVRVPLEFPQCFHPLTHPIRRLVAVYGAKVPDKLSATVAASKQQEYKIVNCTPDKPGEAAAEILKILEGGTKLIFLDHGDVLILEPDSQETVRVVRELPQIASAYGAIIVFLMDRIILDDADKTVFARQFRADARRAFGTATIYYDTPNSQWKAEYCKLLISLFLAHATNVQCTLEDSNYISLADASPFCHADSIASFLRERVFYVLSVPDDIRKERDLLLSYDLIKNAYITKPRITITNIDHSMQENQFCMAAGKGSILDALPKQKKIKSETKIEEDEEKPGFH